MIEASAKILLIPRPRRFGKTLNMTTLQTWFERLPTGETYTHLLDGLKADQTPGEHHYKRGRIPVIILTLKDIKESSWETTFVKISRVVQSEARRLEPWWANHSIHPSLAADIQSLVAETLRNCRYRRRASQHGSCRRRSVLYHRWRGGEFHTDKG